MFFYILLLTVACHYNPPMEYNKEGSFDDYFEQQIDHFNPFDHRTFKQRYFVTDTYWKKKTDPVLYHICGENSSGGNPKWLNEFAEEINALIVTLEHRYYGDSCPFDKNNLSNENLRYLSTRQAIEDLANFRKQFQMGYLGEENNNKWIVVGGSYSGALSAWSRLKHPEIYVGSWASSAVVNTLYQFPQFDEQLAIAVGDECANNLRNVTSIIEKLVLNKETRNETLEKIDAGLSEIEDGDFFYGFADTTILPIQYGYLYCDYFNPSKDLFESYIKMYNEVFKPNFGKIMDYSIQSIMNTKNGADRMWWFQKCADVAYFQVAPEKGSIRSKQVDLDYHLQKCKRAFGIEMIEELIERTTIYFSGLEIDKNMDKILFMNGSQDPWQAAGIVPENGSNMNNIIHMVNCKNCGHCVEQYSCPGGCEGSEYDKAKALVKQTLKEWLK